MQHSFDQLSPETIQNGFKACGLFPLDSNSIDYSKCFGKFFKKKHLRPEVVPEENIEVFDKQIVDVTSEPCLNFKK